MLETDGSVDALQLTGGFTGRTPMYLMRGENPLPRLANEQRSLLMRDEGFEFVAMARALLREPDLPAGMADGRTDASMCVPCNRCVVEMERGGTRCVFRS